VEGYEKIKYYLENELVDGFKKIHKYYQNSNLGALGNYEFLSAEVFRTNDRVIFTEDDNEFSQNFLDYINKGFDIFGTDDSIFRISGHKSSVQMELEEGNVFKISEDDVWGCGIWRDKEYECRKWINRENLMKIVHDKNACKLVQNTREDLYFSLIEAVLANPDDKHNVYIGKDGDITAIDYTNSIYLIIHNMTSIMPIVSKVRNNGFDGTGVNCRKEEFRIPEILDENKYFDYDIPHNFNLEQVNQIFSKTYTTKKMKIKARVYRFIICLFGISVARKINNAMYLLDSKCHSIFQKKHK
jgi:hypothetical protein